MSTSIPSKIRNLLAPEAKRTTIADVRIGLRYTSVRLENGRCGVSWTSQEGAECCSANPGAAPLTGRNALELLDMLSDPAPMRRTLGLATANALSADMALDRRSPGDVLDAVDIDASDHVAMVGLFGPLLQPLRASGCRLDILELNGKPGTLAPLDGRAALKDCSVAIVTSTSIVTGTIDEVLSCLGGPRAVVMLGPSTFMAPEVYADSPVTHLAGARVVDPAGVEMMISEGAGTRALKRHMRFETITLGS
jgi:uncharacterized protein (DUF4213/DUF364 family)